MRRVVLKLLWLVILAASVGGPVYLIGGELHKQKLAANYAGLKDYHQLHKFDPRRPGGHLLPNINEIVRGEFAHEPVQFITNSQGFRNKQETGLEPDPGTFRVLFMGDSFVDGMRTAQDQTIGYLLEEKLGPSSEVLISGHNNPANAWYYYQEHGQKFKPNVVILGLTLGNDITWHNFGAGVLPADNGSVELKVGAAQTGAELPDLKLPSAAYANDAVWEKEFEIRRDLARKYDFFSQLVPPVTGPKVSKSKNAYAGGFFTSLGLFYQPLMPEIEKMYSDTEAVLKGLHSLVNSNGSEFIVVFFPARFQVEATDWNLLHRELSLDTNKFDLDYPNQRLTKFCRKKEITCLDPTASMKIVSSRFRSLYRSKGDMHFNEAGNQLVAEFIAAKFR